MTAAAQIVPAATILMVRDSGGLEVLMLKRHEQTAFAGGALVFPGGKMADEDLDPNWRALVDGADGDEVATGLRIAAIREAYEECGLLIARPASHRGAGARLVQPDDAPHLFATTNREGGFYAAIRDAGLVLALDALTPFSNWLTPKLPIPKRFDTHFFVAVAPAEQAALCDGRETIDLCWVAPDQALQDAAENTRSILFPTRMNLAMLNRSESAAAAIADARARPIMKIEPELFWRGGIRMLRIPADLGFSAAEEPI